jgi:hypothetical protein
MFRQCQVLCVWVYSSASSPLTTTLQHLTPRYSAENLGRKDLGAGGKKETHKFSLCFAYVLPMLCLALGRKDLGEGGKKESPKP